MTNVVLPQLIYKRWPEIFCIFNWFTSEKDNSYFHLLNFQIEFAWAIILSHTNELLEAIHLYGKVVDPYFCLVKKEISVSNYQKTLILFDVFNVQWTSNVTTEHLNIAQVIVSKNMTHLLEPLYLMINALMKKIETKCFRKCFANAIAKEMLCNPKRNVEVGIHLSTLKPEHAKVMRNVYRLLQPVKGSNLVMVDYRATAVLQLWIFNSFKSFKYSAWN